MSAAIACGSDDPISPIAAASGSYTLQTVNGVLPFSIYHSDGSGQTQFDLVSGNLVLDMSGTFREEIHYHVIPPAPQSPGDDTVTTNGFFKLNGRAITFTVLNQFKQPYTWAGAVASDRITYTDPLFSDVNGGITAIYVK